FRGRVNSDGWAGYQWLGLRLRIVPALVEGSCGDVPQVVERVEAPDPCTGVWFQPLERAEDLGGDYLVVLRGDAILADQPTVLPDGTEVRLALDGNHFGPGLPKRCPTGDKTEGGRFESWFTVSRPM
ncbi:MAG: hypothetical protein ACRDPR_01150, partial [Nocardioidaceae bacterium]